MTEFYFVRHGETLVNQRNAFNGGLVDEPLTARGVATAKATGAYLAKVPFVQAVASSMPRAHTTADYILEANAHPVPLALADGLREMRLGAWDGKTINTIPHDQALEAYFHDPVGFDRDYAAVKGVEPYHAVLARSRAVVASAFAAHPQGPVLIVAHGLVFQLLLYTLLGVPFAELRQPPMLHNATVSRLDTLDGQHFTKALWDYQP